VNSLANLQAQLEKNAGAGTAAAERERLIAEHLPQVRLIARRIHDRLPGHVSLEDLMSTGIVGLISAIDRYEPTVGVKLRTYAEYKIRGAILDSLRDLDWAPRKQRRRAKEIERAIAAAEQRIQTAPTEQDIASELGVSVDEYRTWASEAHNLAIGSIENRFADEENREPLRQIADREDLQPGILFERAELQQLLGRAMQRMPQPERTVLNLYYRQEMSLREIAGVMELHESRISQLKTQALGRLRTFLDARWPQRGAEVQRPLER
jgi:RNA polymerase sigma factor for flagellar operon FliA